jgi:hypothetical protein
MRKQIEQTLASISDHAWSTVRTAQHWTNTIKPREKEASLLHTSAKDFACATKVRGEDDRIRPRRDKRATRNSSSSSPPSDAPRVTHWSQHRDSPDKKPIIKPGWDSNVFVNAPLGSELCHHLCFLQVEGATDASRAKGALPELTWCARVATKVVNKRPTPDATIGPRTPGYILILLLLGPRVCPWETSHNTRSFDRSVNGGREVGSRVKPGIVALRRTIQDILYRSTWQAG